MTRLHFDCGNADVDPYALMTSLIVPRPIAWISTVSADGVGNLAPHSFFSVASASPPIVCFTSVGHKDTLANIRATGEFVINLATEPLLELVNDSAAQFAPDVDESDALGIEMEPSTTVAVPRVASSPASMECRLHSLTELGDSVLVLGDLLHVTVADEAVLDGRPRIDRLKPVSRLGGNEWGLTPTVRAVDRPTDPDDIQR